MTKDVIEIAREAGLVERDHDNIEVVTLDDLPKLAALVAAQERERIAKLSADLAGTSDFDKSTCDYLAAAIRALNTEGDEMTDREMLEFAAKAAGWPNTEFQDMRGWGEVRYGLSEALWVPELDRYWNPLTDCGDAFRLAVKLKMRIGIDAIPVGSVVVVSDDKFSPDTHERIGDDATHATCRAIVRAAAEIGKAMP